MEEHGVKKNDSNCDNNVYTSDFRDGSAYFFENVELSTTFVRLCQYCVNFCILMKNKKATEKKLVSYKKDFKGGGVVFQVKLSEKGGAEMYMKV